MVVTLKLDQVGHAFTWTWFLVFMFPVHSWGGSHILWNIPYIVNKMLRTSNIDNNVDRLNAP